MPRAGRLGVRPPRSPAPLSRERGDGGEGAAAADPARGAVRADPARYRRAARSRARDRSRRRTGAALGRDRPRVLDRAHPWRRRSGWPTRACSRPSASGPSSARFVNKAVKRLERKGIDADGHVVGTRKSTKRILQEAGIRGLRRDRDGCRPRPQPRARRLRLVPGAPAGPPQGEDPRVPGIRSGLGAAFGGIRGTMRARPDHAGAPPGTDARRNGPMDAAKRPPKPRAPPMAARAAAPA